MRQMSEPEDVAELCRHINLWKAEIKGLQERITRSEQVLRDLQAEKERFACPAGKTNVEALCGTCERARPRVSPQGFVLPDDSVVSTALIDPATGKGTCWQWERKRRGACCGCGGEWTCVCGYREQFCGAALFSPLNAEQAAALRQCPFCGRQVAQRTYPVPPWTGRLLPKGPGSV